MVNVLVLGGVGFIGRHFVHYLVSNNLASFVRVADKSHPMTSYLSEPIQAAFNNKGVVEFVQADLTKQAHVDKAFKLDGQKFDYVVNLCGETRCGQNENDYKMKCLETAKLCGQAARAHGVKRFVEVSTAQIYESKKTPSGEKDKTSPWTLLAKYRLQAEQALQNMGLPLVVLRPAIAYGPGDLTGLTPRICCAAVYKLKGDTMKFLWTKSHKINTVHVSDVVNALWLACTEFRNGSVYNLADMSATEQGHVNSMLADIFGIKTSFYGTMMSKAAQVNLSAVADMANDKHVPGFTQLCQKNKILNTPLSPYIDKELLYNNHLSVNGSRIESETSFRYRNPRLTTELVRQQINDFVARKLLPPLV